MPSVRRKDILENSSERMTTCLILALKTVRSQPVSPRETSLLLLAQHRLLFSSEALMLFGKDPRVKCPLFGESSSTLRSAVTPPAFEPRNSGHQFLAFDAIAQATPDKSPRTVDLGFQAVLRDIGAPYTPS